MKQVASFNIKQLNILTLGLEKDCEANVSRVAPLARRRLSQCAKFSFGATADLDLDQPIVFSSYLGEINRCFDLLSTLKDEVSPTSFSLSVLNAVAALLSIEDKNHNEILAISAPASFEYGVLNALKFDRAMVISYFEGVNKGYFKSDPFCIAVAASITKGNEYTLSFEPSDKPFEISELNVFKNFNKNTSWTTSDGALTWKWQKI
ncbi:beta-ketoacyl synthase chain length factor [Campylobacter suis]|uniref:Beta-ketoacyl synthase-like N-terminal domain-containing protein n=1 Tax=Campylobacter suis TaxID=2790657 RepID=A0ABN7K3V9_9BACT|nr:beta-ketoacyl synthase chain length factor [Campylobacter suis]CAD7286181.1 hypothetical protein LMG8286_00012 [Campylobacter suis]